ncbi:alpha/beta fold hydrolase [bacterium]|nr:alpha/beta fold hydrolase [bacterium]MBU1938006.1 alpha/beta fold hydrolase [bacterium]
MFVRHILIVCALFVAVSGLLAAAPQEVVFTTVDSVTIYGTFYPSQTEGDSPALVLLHMLRHKRKDWEDFARRATQAGFSVLAIDMRGHGQSVRRAGKAIDVKEFSNKDFSMMVEDVKAAVGFIQTKEGIDPKRISLIGASIGANIALRYAVSDETIRSVVLLSPGLNYRDITTEDAMKAYGKRPALLVAALDDDYPADSIQKLAEIAKGKVKTQLYEKAGHGTFMFRVEPGLNELILDWLKSGKK